VTSGAAAKSRGPVSAAKGIDMGLLPTLLGYHLRSAHIAVFKHFGRTVGEADISPPQLGTLLLIEANAGISQSAVAKALRFDRSTLVQVVDRLEERGLVKRETSTRDRRSHALALTAAGVRLLARLKEMLRTHESEIAAALSTDERATLIGLLDRLHIENRRG
jgi:DNA-binding MarR family transcriptional regulator